MAALETLLALTDQNQMAQRQQVETRLREVQTAVKRKQLPHHYKLLGLQMNATADGVKDLTLLCLRVNSGAGDLGDFRG